MNFRATKSSGAILVLVLLVCVSLEARKVRILTYQELFDRSDLVVIATPSAKTKDISERSFLPGIFSQNATGKQSKIQSVGVETPFKVALTLKGNGALTQFVLHHYREAVQGAELDGPGLISFDPGSTDRRSCLMFLVRESDGRYAPTGGQTDPALQSIVPVPLEIGHSGAS
jgi:hypothetical protein